MRSREEIEYNFKGLFSGSYETKLLLEVVLDIRELITKKEKVVEPFGGNN